MENGYLAKIIQKINSYAKSYDLGELQKIRKEIIGLKRLPSQEIFTSATIFDDWAFHYGGRKELQFNVGLELIANINYIRFGVAFSLERSQSLQSIDILIPKIALFNDVMQSNSENFADMRMWHYQGERSSDYLPSPISPELVTEGVFIFLGVKQPVEDLDYDLAVKVMNRLLPLYLYTETDGRIERKKSSQDTWSFNFKPGCTSKASSTSTDLFQKQLSIGLRHNDIQEALEAVLKNLESWKVGAKCGFRSPYIRQVMVPAIPDFMKDRRF